MIAPTADDDVGRILQALFAGESTSDPGLPYLLLPNGRRPRFLVPARPRHVVAAALSGQLTGRRPRTRFVRSAMRPLASTGVLGRLWPARVTVSSDSGGPSLAAWLATTLGIDRCHLAIALGRPRANRKPVVQVLDDAGTVRAFVKLGHTPLTKDLVNAEAANLAEVADANLRDVRIPAVMHHAQWHDLAALVLEPLPIQKAHATNSAALVGRAQPLRSSLAPWSRRSVDLRPHIVRTVRQIATVGQQAGVRWTHSEFRGRLVAQIANNGERVARLRDVVRDVDEHDPVLTFGAWHGDFNPGNFALHDDGMQVWDWERFDHAVPLGFDLLHHDFHQNVTHRSVDPALAASALVESAAATLHPLGLSATAAHATASAYLAWLACRYVHDAQDDHGVALGRVEQWLPALQYDARA